MSYPFLAPYVLSTHVPESATSSQYFSLQNLNSQLAFQSLEFPITLRKDAIASEYLVPPNTSGNAVYPGTFGSDIGFETFYSFPYALCEYTSVKGSSFVMNQFSEQLRNLQIHESTLTITFPKNIVTDTSESLRCVLHGCHLDLVGGMYKVNGQEVMYNETPTPVSGPSPFLMFLPTL